MNHLDRAVKDRFLAIDRKAQEVTYLPHRKTRSLKNPEEEIQLQAFLELLYDYRYPAGRIKVSDPVKMGSATKEADIMVYQDDACKQPYIVVECKRREVSKAQFDEAVDQGFSYAAATGAKFVWTTSGRYEAHFEVLPRQMKEREANRLPRIPRHAEKRLGWYRWQTAAFRALGSRWRMLWDNPIFTDAMLYAATISVLMVVGSRVMVHYLPYIYRLTESWWKEWMHFGHLFNALAAGASVLTLLAGMFFMRSHRLFGAPMLNRRLDFLAIAAILYLPAWYMSIANRDPEWWTWAHYKAIEWKSKIFLWPFLKALPVQIMAVYGIIWAATRAPKAKPKKRR
jgi:hypothetical protein